jgi:hypothetical protein
MRTMPKAALEPTPVGALSMPRSRGLVAPAPVRRGSALVH